MRSLVIPKKTIKNFTINDQSPEIQGQMARSEAPGFHKAGASGLQRKDTQIKS